MDDKTERVAERFSDALGGLRDRTADTVRADGGSVFRELAKLGKRIDDSVDGAQSEVVDRVAASEAAITSRLDKVAAGQRRTSMPRRLFWLLAGAAIGVAAAYLADPEQGRTRRAKLNDQAMAQGRHVAGEVKKRAKISAERTKGQVIEQVKDALPEDVPADAGVLEQRIKSDVFGHRTDTSKVVIRIDGPGVVTLKGTVPTATSERELLTAVAEVEGVVDVLSELRIG